MCEQALKDVGSLKGGRGVVVAGRSHGQKKRMTSKGRILPKATPAMAQRVWARHQRPSTRNVARALTLAGKPVHYGTVARWKRQNWRPVRSDHPLEVARSQIEAVAPLVTGDPETRLDDIIGVPEGKDLDQSADGELLRKAARELAIAIALVAKAIQGRTAAAFDMAEVAPALLSIGACLAALPSAFDQAISLDAADWRSDRLRTKA